VQGQRHCVQPSALPPAPASRIVQDHEPARLGEFDTAGLRAGGQFGLPCAISVFCGRPARGLALVGGVRALAAAACQARSLVRTPSAEPGPIRLSFALARQGRELPVPRAAPGWVIVVVEDPVGTAGQLLVADEHRGCPVSAIPAVEPSEYRPRAIADAEMTELAHEHGVGRLQAADFLQLGNLRVRRAEEVAEQHPARVGASYQAHGEAAGAVATRPVALAVCHMQQFS